MLNTLFHIFCSKSNLAHKMQSYVYLIYIYVYVKGKNAVFIRIFLFFVHFFTENHFFYHIFEKKSFFLLPFQNKCVNLHSLSESNTIY